jgi:hypothetical protein
MDADWSRTLDRIRRRRVLVEAVVDAAHHIDAGPTAQDKLRETVAALDAFEEEGRRADD